MPEPLTVETFRRLINTGEMSDPLAFLEAIMGGQDPRALSGLSELVADIQEFSMGEPTSADWAEVVVYVETFCKYRSVSLSESLMASKTLAEYVHAKRKTVEITGGSGGTKDPSANPLTEEEIELFKERFNDEF